jgi:plastocyanin
MNSPFSLVASVFSRRARLFSATAAVLALCPWAAAAGAVVEGTVVLPQARTTPVANQRYEIVSNAGVLATNPPVAVVYLEGSFDGPAERPVKEVAQKDLAFVPSLLAIQTGTKVEFPNLDPAYHNIFSFSPARRFDLGRYRSDEKPVPSVVFDNPGLVTLRCDIHEHMRALILVLPTPYFVTTDVAGHYRLENLPAGKYTLKAWINSRTTREQTVELTDGGSIRADFR